MDEYKVTLKIEAIIKVSEKEELKEKAWEGICKIYEKEVFDEPRYKKNPEKFLTICKVGD